MQTKKSSQLELKDLLLNLHLGITKQEQLNKQPVYIDISIENNTPPLGCETDNIKNTLCYDELCKQITDNCSPKTYNLIEHLCQDIIDIISTKAQSNAKICVSVKKSPPIENLALAKFSIFRHS